MRFLQVLPTDAPVFTHSQESRVEDLNAWVVPSQDAEVLFQRGEQTQVVLRIRTE